MTKYRIPKPFINGFELISKLNEKQVRVIKIALMETPIGSGPEQTAKTLVGKEGLKTHELISILSTVFSLISLNIREEVEKDEFINDILTSFNEISPELKEPIRKKLLNHLNVFLGADGKVKHTIKAATLQRENERNFIESRLLSNIRIVFEENIENSQQCAVVIHQLKIVYDENGEQKEIFFALDIEDLIQLKETADRAIVKGNLIKTNTYKELSFIDLNKK